MHVDGRDGLLFVIKVAHAFHAQQQQHLPPPFAHTQTRGEARESRTQASLQGVTAFRASTTQAQSLISRIPTHSLATKPQLVC